MSRLIDAKPSIESQLNHTQSSPISLPPHYVELAGELISRHGSIRVAREERGLHFYIACPECLDDYGASELQKKHLAINVDRYFAMGNDYGAMCMKHGGVYRITELTAWPLLEDRGIEYKPEAAPMVVGPNMDLLEPDGQGNLIPKHPGVSIPTTSLPDTHPARIYLASRHFDPQALWDHLQCSYCEEENPDLYYRKQPGGFRVTPQGRLIFYGYQFGVRVTWQARILEMEEANQKYFFHPYKKDWVHVLSRADIQSPWQPISGYEDWDMAKYFTAPGTRRNYIWMAYDAAVNFHAGVNNRFDRWCMVVEGPLDAGRLGPPAMPLIGKFMSAEQARLLEEKFGRVVVIRDNDEAGELSEKKIREALTTKDVIFKFMTLPPRFKDPGDLSAADVLFVRAKARRLIFS